jgi:hypothetical protein
MNLDADVKYLCYCFVCTEEEERVEIGQWSHRHDLHCPGFTADSGR